MTHLGLGFANIYCQYSIGTWALTSKIILLVIILISLLKTFFFMRIVKKFSYIVTMINRVFVDLLVFLLFFVIQIIMFSQLFNIISPPAIHATDEDGQFNNEYRYIGPWMGNLLTTLRLSLGDFNFDPLNEPEYVKADDGKTFELNPHRVNQTQHIIFWTVWILMVVFTALVFLNFIIAEVSNSYLKVKSMINNLIYRERATLTQEAEDLMSDEQRMNRILFPKFFVIREVEK